MGDEARDGTRRCPKEEIARERLEKDPLEKERGTRGSREREREKREKATQPREREHMRTQVRRQCAHYMGQENRAKGKRINSDLMSSSQTTTVFKLSLSTKRVPSGRVN